MRLLPFALCLCLCSPALAQEPTETPIDTATPTATPTITATPTPCPDLTRQVLDVGTGQTVLECYSDPGTTTEPTAVVLDGIAAAAKVQVDLDYEALRAQYATAKQWLDLMDQHAATLAAMTTAQLDTVAELRPVLKTMGEDLGRLAEIQRRQLRVLARIIGDVGVEPQPTPTP